jgi:AcrR family transcriptional regulator
MTEKPAPNSRENLLDAAERLFMARGYDTVTLRDIAAEVGIKHTSLYHHVPGGKPALYLEVVERAMHRHRISLQQAVAAAPDELLARVYAVAEWVLSQPPMDVTRMARIDLPATGPEHAHRLGELTRQAFFTPIEEALAAAQARGEIDPYPTGQIAGAIFGLIQSHQAIPDEADFSAPTRLALARQSLTIFVRGLKRSVAEGG